jgi:lysozyme
MSRVRKSATVAALAVGVVGGFEGLRQTAYPDPATKGHPWTICYGHTGPDVSPGVRKSLEECKALLVKDLDKHAEPLERCIKVPMSDSRYVAVLSLAVNIGSAGVCKSSIVRLLNAGEDKAACDAFLKFNRAAGFVMPGLTRRREAERRLCLA